MRSDNSGFAVERRQRGLSAWPETNRDPTHPNRKFFELQQFFAKYITAQYSRSSIQHEEH